MKILVTGRSMTYLSGQPLFCYELCRELKRSGHDVTMLSRWVGKPPEPMGEDGHILKDNLIRDGIKQLEWGTKLVDDYDLCLASEIMSKDAVKMIPNTPVINMVHSEYDVEEPLPDSPQIVAYVCIRWSIMQHITKEHAIPRHKCVIIYNGVDRQRFKPMPKPKRDYYKVVVPCTLDTMREPFLNKLIDEANPKKHIHLYGIDCGADEVAGILLGRVNLEAWSCGVNSSIYDPDTLEGRLFPPPRDFDENYNIRNTTAKILAIAGNLDDITVVIPHHSARAKLAVLLESIKTMKNVVIVKGGSFARNCNAGVRLAETKYILLTNDDTSFKPQHLLREMMRELKTSDIVGATPNNGCKGFNIVDGFIVEEQDCHYPSGALLMMKKETYDKLNGFNEGYVNGAEDIDMFLRAEKMGMVVKRLPTVYHHDCSQSEGRFDNLTNNITKFNNHWKGVVQIPQ
jgi:hypothetical protein